jgi:hypothetical protein
MAPKIIRVSPWHLRRLFKKGEFLAKIQKGELDARLIRQNHLTEEKAFAQGQPFCTHSQTFQYLRDSVRVVTVHQYLLPDGSLGGRSKLPDPKYLEYEGLTYAVWVKDSWYKKGWFWVLGWIAGIRYKLFG